VTPPPHPQCAGKPGRPELQPRRRTLVLLYTSDEHSQLLAVGPELDDYPAAAPGPSARRGGIARRATRLNFERAVAKATGADTLTVSAGDVSMGTLAQLGFTAGADYQVLKALGYDAATIGNHELDWGPAALAQAIGAATSGKGAPQLVASNLHFSANDPGDDELAALFGGAGKPVVPYHVIETAGGIKVGLVGVLGAGAAHDAAFKAPLRGSGLPEEESDFGAVRKKIVADLQPSVDALRQQHKVDLVVALSHGGVDLQHPELGDDQFLAQQLDGVDVIVSGHTHLAVKAPIVVKSLVSSREVLVVQASALGAYLGRLVLTLEPGRPVAFDAQRSTLIPIDDTTIPSPAAASMIDALIKDLEQSGAIAGALSRITGQPVKDDPSTSGDLFFYKLGQTGFSVPGLKPFVETNLLNLVTDAELAGAIAALPGEPPTIAVEAAGQVRADLEQGKTGALAFADVYRVLPLGASPFDGSPGYPLAHYYVNLVELKAALEMAADLGLTRDSYYLGAAGVRVTVDTTRPAFVVAGDPTDAKNGRVTKIEWDSQRRVGAEQYDVVLFDASRGEPWVSSAGGPTTLVHVVTDLYLAAGVASFGVTIKDKDGKPLPLPATVIHRADGSELKAYEALAAYIHGACAANFGMLPDRYDGSAAAGKLPRRNLCSGPLCGSY
jgi:5'-nucleotidase